MDTATDRFGAVNYLTIVFPRSQIPTAGFDQLLALVNDNVIRVLDMEFVTIADGVPAVVDADSISGHLSLFDGACSGLLDEADLRTATVGVEPDSVAAVIVYELLPMLPVIRAFERTGATVTSEGPVEVCDIDDALNTATQIP